MVQLPGVQENSLFNLFSCSGPGRYRDGSMPMRLGGLFDFLRGLGAIQSFHYEGLHKFSNYGDMLNEERRTMKEIFIQSFRS